MTSHYSAAETLVDTLAALGTTDIFTLCGNHVLPIAEALRVRDLRVVATRSEASAVFAADAYGRVARRPGIALVTGGPGMSNTVTGMMTAQGNRSPVVVISGEPDQSGEGQGAQQEANHIGLAADASKWQRSVRRPEHVEAAVVEAYRVAQSGRTGAVHLSVPLDVLRAPNLQRDPRVSGGAVATGVPPQSFVDVAVEALRRAARPVVIAGAGVWQHGGENALTELADVCGVPIFTVDSARGAIADDHPCCFGSADRGLNMAAGRVHRADLVVVLGRAIDFRLGIGTVFDPDATVIHVDTDLPSLGRNAPSVQACLGDPAAFLIDLTDGIRGHRIDDTWLEELRGVRQQQEAVNAGSIAATGQERLHPAAVAEVLGRAGNAHGAIFSLDCGEFVQWARQVIPAINPGRWLRLGPQATCGAGLPFGIGAKVARPDLPSLVIAGDGGVGYHIADLETAVREDVPLVLVVGQDDGWGIERNLQQGIYGPGTDFTTVLDHSDLVGVAQGFGATAVAVDDLDALEEAVAAGFQRSGPTLVSVNVATVPSVVTHQMVDKERQAIAGGGRG